MHAPTPPPIPADLLLAAYCSGIFPMADAREDPEIFWVEPRRRAILPLDGFHLSRTLRKTIARDEYAVTCNTAFDQVIEACAAPRPDHPESWISRRIAASYRALHATGQVHSIECWHDGALAGGLYGVGFGGVFCGESMFSRRADASKVALAWLVALMNRSGAKLLDCQFMTDHLASMGAVEIPQKTYLALLSSASEAAGAVALPDAFAALEADASAAGLSPAKLILQSLTQTS